MKIKNWKKFQHYKERRPPWIKLHRDILDDYAINLLAPDAFRFLIQLWILASEDELLEGNLPPIKEIAYRLRLNENKVLDYCKQVASFLLADCYQNARLEEKRREEVDILSKSSSSSSSNGKTTPSTTEWFEEDWKLYPNRDGKRAALKHYTATVKTEADRGDLLKALDNYKKHLQVESWKKPKNGSTWFNNWKDWVNWEEPKSSDKIVKHREVVL